MYQFARQLILIILFITPYFLYPQEKNGIPFITNYSPEIYNSAEQNWSIAQDNRGIIYVANSETILVYDGKNWRSIDIQNNMVRSLFADSNGNIYVGLVSDFGQLVADSIGLLKYQSFTHLLDSSINDFYDIWKIYSQKDTLLFCSEGYIFKYVSPNYLSVFQLDSMSFLSFKSRDKIFVSDWNAGLYEFTEDSLHKFEGGHIFSHKDIFCVNDYFENGILVGTRENGIYTKSHKNKEFTKAVFHKMTDSLLQNGQIYHCLNLSSNKYVFSTLRSGVIITDSNGNIELIINKESGILDKTVTSSYSNKQSNSTSPLWLTLNLGISKLEINSPFSLYTDNSGLEGIVNDIIRYQGVLFVATSSGVFYLDENSGFQPEFKPIKGISCFSYDFSIIKNNITDSLYNSKLWVGTDIGIYQITNTPAKVQLLDFNNPTYSIIQSSKQIKDVFIGTKYGLATLKFENPSYTNLGYINNLEEEIYSLEIDSNNTLWMGTVFDGIIRFNNIDNTDTAFYFYGKEKGLLTLEWNELYFDDKYGLLTANDNGIQKYNDSKDRFEVFKGFGNRYANEKLRVIKITKDYSGHYWLIVSDGSKSWIEKVILHDNGEVEIQKAPFNRLQNKSLDVIYHDKDSITWIGHSKGIYKYDAKFKRSYKNKFYCLIRKVDLNSDSTIFYGTMTNDSDQVTTEWQKKYKKILPYKENTISFEYAAPFFENEKATVYSYYLKGFDKKWSKWSNETKAIYTNLPEGDYVFYAKAKNTYDYESETGEYHFSILAPYYRTNVAYIIYFIVFVLLIWVVVRLNSIRLRKQNEHLEQIINERTEEIRAQKDQIEMQNEELVRLDEYKQGLTGMIVHDLKNPLNHILNVPDSEPKKNLQFVKQSGRQMLNMVLDILDVSKYENATMQIEQKHVQVAEIFNRAVEQVLFLAENKNISFHLNIPDEHVIFADSEIIERICINLFTNAIKYSPNNSIVGACSIIHGDLIRIEICNTGSYIAPELIDKVFDKFSQLDAKKSGSIRSTGLGLTFCKMAIEAHMGKIGVESDKEKGTTFWFMLPKGQKDIQIIDYNLSNKYKKKTENISSTFSAEDIICLQPYIADLKQVKVYQLSKSKKILDSIESNESAAIENWKSKLMQTIFNGNQEEYDKLLDI